MLLINISFVLRIHAAKNGAYLGIKRLLMTDPICTYGFPESYYRSDSFCLLPVLEAPFTSAYFIAVISSFYYIRRIAKKIKMSKDLKGPKLFLQKS